MRDLLVTGTDTGVGKTMIAAALVTALRARGVRAIGFKPVETGIGAGRPVRLRRAGARLGRADTCWRGRCCSCAEPLAPAVAAERAGVTLDPDDIEARIDNCAATATRSSSKGPAVSWCR